MYIMCAVSCLISALSRRVGALPLSVIIIIYECNTTHHISSCTTTSGLSAQWNLSCHVENNNELNVIIIMMIMDSACRAQIFMQNKTNKQKMHQHIPFTR